MIPTDMHWLIVGPGALGQLYAGKLAQRGHSVSTWGRQGLQPKQQFVWHDRQGIPHCWQSQTLNRPFDAVLVTTKIFQSDTATQAVLNSGLVSHQCPLILMHNGLGAGEQLQRLHPDQPLLLASSRQGALKTATTEVRHTGQGSTQLGLIQGDLSSEQQERLIKTLDRAVGEVTWHPEIMLPLWQKLIINAVVNPLTARDKVSNGELLAPQYERELQILCDEACSVAQAAGFELNSPALLAQILQVLKATAQNRSSMLQDVLHQRATEIDYINGYLVRQAQHYQVQVPAHEQVLQQIHQLEKGFTL